MVRSNTEAYKASLKTTTNVPGTCQLKTRTWFDAPSAGDQDHDKDADANDGWKSEPAWAKVFGDRTPPVGAPLYFKNADGTGFGHRCISTGKGSGARSTDMKNGQYTKGVTSNTTIERLESEMGLTYVGWSRTITGIQIPGLEKPKAKPPKPPKKKPTPKPPKKPAAKKDNEVMVRMSHASMQFSDSVKHKNEDSETIFKRAREAGHWWVTGTEAIEISTRQALSKAAKKYGFFIYFGDGTDVWVAVNMEVVKKGTRPSGWSGPVVVRGQKGKFASKKVVRVTFTNPEIGEVVVYPAHSVLGVHPALQKLHMEAIGKDAKRQAAGKRLAFMGADTNRQDKKFDMAYGNGFISCWDDLKEYPSTGHGTIDGIFRWKADGRVRCFNANANDDTELPLNTDHFQIAAAYAVKKL